MAGFLEALQEIPSVHARHGQIEQDDVRMMQVQRALSFLTVARQQYLKTVLSERGRQHSPQRQIVVDHEDAFAIDIGDALTSTVLETRFHRNG